MARDVEEQLAGKSLHEQSAQDAADVAFSDAKPRERNAYKIPLGKAALVRALLQTEMMEI
jgi:xanthine dehydrogenase YagS FAD-binding subunit